MVLAPACVGVNRIGMVTKADVRLEELLNALIRHPSVPTAIRQISNDLQNKWEAEDEKDEE